MNIIGMRQCDIGNDPEILPVILWSDFEHIDLSHNNTDSLRAVKISEYIENNPPINAWYLIITGSMMMMQSSFLEQ